MKALHIKVPKSWNELSTKQIKKICYNLYNATKLLATKNCDANKVNTVAYYNIVKTLLKNNKRFVLKKVMRELPVLEYKPFAKFIFEEVNLQKFPKKFKFLTPLHGPSLRLRNITIGEFSFVDSIYYKFKATDDVKYLNLLCATLYRKKDKLKTNSNDIRIPFDRLLTEKNYRKFNKVPLTEKLPVLFAYEGSRNYLVKSYPTVFPKSKKNTNSNTKSKYIPFGELIASKIEYDPSKIETTNNINVYTFFSIYENELRQIKKTKKQR